MIKTLSVIFLILGWLFLLNARVPNEVAKCKGLIVSLLILAIGTILTFFSFVN